MCFFFYLRGNIYFGKRNTGVDTDKTGTGQHGMGYKSGQVRTARHGTAWRATGRGNAGHGRVGHGRARDTKGVRGGCCETAGRDKSQLGPARPGQAREILGPGEGTTRWCVLGDVFFFRLLLFSRYEEYIPGPRPRANTLPLTYNLLTFPAYSTLSHLAGGCCSYVLAVYERTYGLPNPVVLSKCLSVASVKEAL